ncbi:uncharacterized protein ACBR49_017720 [Aulostomus maculatus]
MFLFVFFCHVWFLQAPPISCSENSTGSGWEVGSLGPDSPSPPPVIRFSVPEDHSLCLLCWGSDGSHAVWTHQNRKVSDTIQDREHLRLLREGSLCFLQLDDSDGGEYCCNQQLVAELQVLSGHDFKVPAGRTLLLPCSVSVKSKQSWHHRREGERRKIILTRFKNGTVKREKDESRFSLNKNALQIQDLQPGDAGEYLCNGELQARVTILAGDPQPPSRCSSTRTTPTVSETGEAEVKREERPENALLLAAVVGLGIMILLLGAICVLLSSVKCRRKRKHRRAAAEETHEVPELQPWTTSISHTRNSVTVPDFLSSSPVFSPSSPVRPDREAFKVPPPADTIYYASLGRQNWRERPSRTPPDADHHDVIYSSVITRPAAKRARTVMNECDLYSV